jgi:hypothetical protein
MLQKSRATLLASSPVTVRNFFTVRRVGNNYGYAIVCPHCEEKPPKGIAPWNRWRWLTLHVVTHNKPADPE